MVSITRWCVSGAGSLLFGQGRLRRTTARARGLQIVRQFGAVADLWSRTAFSCTLLHKAFIKHLLGCRTQLRVWKQDSTPGLVSGALPKRYAILFGQQQNPESGCWSSAGCVRCSLRTLLKSFTRAGRRNPGLVLQLRLSWAMVYFGSPTFLGFLMTAACSHWLDSGQRGGTLVQTLAPSYNVTCLVNSRKYVVKEIKTENMKSTHLSVICGSPLLLGSVDVS